MFRFKKDRIMHSRPIENIHRAQDANGQPKARVSGRAYDSDTLHVLEISRIFFVSFNDPSAQIWMKAYDLGERTYGVPMGATVAQATLHMANEMRCTRPHHSTSQIPAAPGVRSI